MIQVQEIEQKMKKNEHEELGVGENIRKRIRKKFKKWEKERRQKRKPPTGFRFSRRAERADLDLGGIFGVDKLAVVLSYPRLVADVLERFCQGVGQEDLVAVFGAEYHPNQPPGLETGFLDILIPEAVSPRLLIIKVVRQPFA